MGDLTVQLNSTHPQPSDLRATLYAPAGAFATLTTGAFWHSGPNFRHTTFDDAARPSLAEATAPYSGTFRPATPLGALAGAAITWGVPW